MNDIAEPDSITTGKQVATPPVDRGSIALFLVLTVLLSGVFWALMIAAGHLDAGAGHYVVGLMWAPAGAAFLTLRFRRRDQESLGLSSIGGKFMLLGYGLPLFYASIAYGLVWILGLGYFPDVGEVAKLAARLGWPLSDATSIVPLYFALIATTGIIRSIAHALGEEIGWRGFLAPALVGRMGFTAGAIVTGLIWTA